ncbi:hypothetical protein ACLOJK_034321, partial [Asimina triloba]
MATSSGPSCTEQPKAVRQQGLKGQMPKSPSDRPWPADQHRRPAASRSSSSGSPDHPASPILEWQAEISAHSLHQQIPSSPKQHHDLRPAAASQAHPSNGYLITKNPATRSIMTAWAKQPKICHSTLEKSTVRKPIRSQIQKPSKAAPKIPQTTRMTKITVVRQGTHLCFPSPN